MTPRQSVSPSDADEKYTAFRNIMEYVRKHPVPKDFDWKKAREEAMIEKYGRYYIEEEQLMSDCLFCNIAAGRIPSKKVYEDELCYAFHDIAPQAPAHFLVIPKTHLASVSAVTPDNCAVVGHIFAVIARLASEMGLESYRVVSNVGEQAGQSVPHLHFHVLSGRDMTWPPG